MKKKKIWPWILLLFFLLFPWRISFAGDGGSVCYGGLFYEVNRYHYFAGMDLDGRYWVYTDVRIFGVEIYESPRRIVQE
ncbi:MAG: hypothetical protein HFF05_01630 [Oscillospiraceae bacterium]|nr:hypothetical protein [Oscillospiraceae bacterium]